MHGFSSISKGYYGQMLKKGIKAGNHTPQYFEHGYINGKSRREAMLIIDIGTDRIIREGLSFTLDSHDSTNAFNCSNPACLAKVVDGLYLEEDKELVKWRFTHNLTKVAIEKRDLLLLPGD